MDLECHITLKSSYEEMKEAQKYIEYVGWSFSCITGDPLLGKDTFCYATHHFTDIENAINQTRALAIVLSIAGFNVLRRKVEQVMSDERYSNGAWVKV